MATRTLTRQSILRLLALIRPKHKKYLLGLTLRVAMTTTERVVIAFLIQMVVDAIIAVDQTAFTKGMINWVAFYVGFTLVAPFVLYLWRSALAEVTANVREAIFRHLNRLPLGYHEAHHSGDALSILTNDLTAAEKAYQDDLFMLAEATAHGLGAVVAMLLLNWQLALLILLSGVAPLIVNALFAGPLRKIGQQVQERLGMLSERMGDLLAGYQVVRTFNLGEWILERFEQANGQVLSTSLKRVRTEAALASGNEFAGIFSFLAIVVGAYFAMTGRATFGVMIALIQLSNNVNYFVYTIGGTVSRVQAALAAADRILALLDTPLEPEAYGPKAAQGLRVEGARAHPLIEFKNVRFGYSDNEDILNALSFQVEKGQMVAFAGPSGGGKSTILKLLLGCYPTRQGEIVLEGRPVNGFRLTDLREQFAYVPQDSYLFAGTIYDNIRYGKPEASAEQIEAAAKAAFAHEFISKFPEGYQTVVGERGARLSGGQRQRIAIARALLKNAPILLLDEATSALDSESEQVVQQALEVLMEGRTTLVVAHRFSTILHADSIYVVEDGRLVEQGTHEELMELDSGVYRNLFDIQFKQENEAEAEAA
ncbi:MAG: ABC transporter ATP-binding protein [Anaerolineaceae bacterium]|nr:ABC transporter ATP-binding protein [Anaerolineaceae bacterium]